MPLFNPKLVSLIVPVFNEEQALPEFINSLISHTSFSDIEIIFINDGSTDLTSTILESYLCHSNIIVLTHRINQGYGSALVTGMRASKRDFVVWCDSDGQHTVSDILKICTKLQDSDLDYCVGVRTKQSSIVRSRLFGKAILRAAVRLLTKEMPSDFNSGLRGFRRSVISKYYSILPSRFGASSVTSILMDNLHYIGSDVPITVRSRVGKSSVNQIKDGFSTLYLILNVFLIFKPFRMFAFIAIFLISFGLIYGIYKTFIDGAGFPVFGAIIFLTGIQSLLLGFVIDQVSALRRERY